MDFQIYLDPMIPITICTVGLIVSGAIGVGLPWSRGEAPNFKHVVYGYGIITIGGILWGDLFLTIAPILSSWMTQAQHHPFKNKEMHNDK